LSIADEHVSCCVYLIFAFPYLWFFWAGSHSDQLLQTYQVCQHSI